MAVFRIFLSNAVYGFQFWTEFIAVQLDDFLRGFSVSNRPLRPPPCGKFDQARTASIISKNNLRD